MDYVLKKANRRLYALRQLKRCGVLPADIVKVYCSLVRSVVEYASVVFSNLPQYLVDALEKLQKRALKIIYPNYSYEAALDAANLEKLECRRVNICSSFVSKLTKSNPVYNLVSGRLKSRTVPQLWNSLPYAIRSSPSVASFKQTLKTFLFQKAFL